MEAQDPNSMDVDTPQETTINKVNGSNFPKPGDKLGNGSTLVNENGNDSPMPNQSQAQTRPTQDATESTPKVEEKDNDSSDDSSSLCSSSFTLSAEETKEEKEAFKQHCKDLKK